jgi:hypothetical protein
MVRRKKNTLAVHARARGKPPSSVQHAIGKHLDDFSEITSDTRNGQKFSFGDVLQAASAVEALNSLCRAGCDAVWLAKKVMGFHIFSSAQAGRRLALLSKQQRRDLCRLEKNLEDIERWDRFPMFLGAEGDTRLLSSYIHELRVKIPEAIKLNAGYAGVRSINTRNDRAAWIVQLVHGATNSRRRYLEEIRTLLDRELELAGDKDFYHNVEAFSRALKRAHHRNGRKPLSLATHG